jgi:D-cysteine desulfhydrase
MNRSSYPLSNRVALVPAPTPLHALDRLAAALDMDEGSLLVKRDDLTGLAGGGNKARKLEYLVADALARGCDWLVSGGGEQSNHARMTAAAAARFGLGCTLVLATDRPAVASGNVLLDAILGAATEWVGDVDGEQLDAAIEATAARLADEGARPYVVPIGGSNALGALGYVNAAQELREQVPDLELVVLATGSCGTQAGLAAGLGDHESVLGVRVGERPDLEALVHAKAAEAAALAQLSSPTGLPSIDHRHLGPGYAVPSVSGLAALNTVARLEGLVLDPVYTGKGMAGLLAARADGRVQRSTRTVFLHTGGLPGLFAHRFQHCWAVPGALPPHRSRVVRNG